MTVATAPRARWRTVTIWIIISAIALLVGAVGSIIVGASQWSMRDRLDPESPGPAGAQALARILADHGVEVVVARDRVSVENALAAGDATLALPDAPYLSDDTIAGLAETATDVVLLDPRARTLRLLLPGTTSAGYSRDEALSPECELGDAGRAGPVVIGALFDTVEDHADRTVGCYPADAGFGLVSRSDGERRTVALDATVSLTNEHLAERGNAALGVNLLGRNPTLVWYMPTIDDADVTVAPTLGELTPEWVTPAILLLITAAVAAAVWRGRRFGPLVAENLPVTVRAAETTEGRARLYERSRDAGHALDQLRIGAIGRLSSLLALGPASTAQETADAAATRTGSSIAEVRSVLLDAIPSTDAELVALSDQLRRLEADVRSAVRWERNTNR